MIDRKILEDALNKRYEEVRKQLINTKAQLPDAYKGFIDEDLSILENVYNQLKSFDVNFYSLKSGSAENIIKEFNFHCNARFNNVLILATPEKIMSYGITYAEYKGR